MKLLKVLSLSFFIFLSFLVGAPVFAEVVSATTAQPPASVSPTTPIQNDSIIIATTNIYNAKIVSQRGTTVDISFDISNREGAQSGLKYSVNLVKKVANNQTKSDMFVYPEIFNIGENTTINKFITYKAPDNLDGEYSVIIEVRNNSGLSLAFGTAGTIKLVATVMDVKNLEIEPETCLLVLEGDKNNNIYTINQGIDIDISEKLFLTCSVVNNLKVETKAIPTFETHYSDLSDEIISAGGGSTIPITFKAGEKKFVAIHLPKATKPQSYTVKVSLKSGNIYSNYITANYVIRGECATIKSVSLDKDNYLKGDTAKLSLFWTASADNFLGSRAISKTIKPLDVTFVASIKDDKQNDCTLPIKRLFSDVKNGGIFTIPLPIIKDCKNPQVKVELKNSNGDILTQKQLSFGEKPITELMLGKISLNKNIFPIIIGVLIVARIIIYIINLKKKKHYKHHNISK